MMKTTSCLARQFARHGELEAADVEALEDVEREPIGVSAGEVLRTQGSPFSDLVVVREGWTCTWYELGDGNRQVVFVHVSGDIAGLHDLPFEDAITTTVALTDATVCRMPRRRLTELIERSPRIAAILVAIQLQQQAILVERLVSLGCRSAIRRTAHLILELDRRRREAVVASGSGIPLSQRQLADCLGLTEVHVNRCIRQLKEASAIAVGRNRLDVLDPDALARFARFDPSFLEPSIEYLGGRPEPERI